MLTLTFQPLGFAHFITLESPDGAQLLVGRTSTLWPTECIEGDDKWWSSSGNGLFCIPLGHGWNWPIEQGFGDQDLLSFLREEGCKHGATIFGAVFISMRFRHLDLSRVSLLGCDLRGSQFEGCNLTGANLSLSILEGVTFRACKLDGATFTQSRFGRAESIVEQAAGLTTINHADSTFEDCSVIGALIERVDFGSMNLNSLSGLDQTIITDVRLRNCLVSTHQFEKPLIAERIGDAFFGVNKNALNNIREFCEASGSSYTKFIPGIEDFPNYARLPFPISPVVCYILDKDSQRFSLARQWYESAKNTYGELSLALSATGDFDRASILRYREKEVERKQADLLSFWRLGGVIYSVLDAMVRCFGAVLLMLVAVCGLPFAFFRFIFVTLKEMVIAKSLRPLLERLSTLFAPLPMSEKEKVVGQLVEKINFGLSKDIDGSWRRQRVKAKIAAFLIRRITLSDAAIYTLMFLGACLAPVLAALWAAWEITKYIYLFLLGLKATASYHFWRSVCGYAEKPERCLWTGLFSLLLFAVILTWLPETRGLTTKELLLLSIDSFSGLGTFKFEASTNLALLLNLECLWGLFLAAIYAWSLGRRVAGR